MCDCIKNVDAEMASAGHNTRVERLIVGPQVALIRTVKADDKKRQKPAVLTATFCPFCGEKYPSKEAAHG